MPVDLAKLYAKVKQRAERDRGLLCADSAEKARQAARAIMDSHTQTAARKFISAERVWLNERDSFLEPVGQEFLEAIRSKDFVCNYRTVNNFKTGYDPSAGWLYLLVSKNRPNQVKIGCTKNSPRASLLRIRRLYERKAFLHYARWVRSPAQLESLLHEEFRDVRVAGNVTGQSIEWFNVEASIVESRILRILAPSSEFWMSEIIYSHDPEASRLVYLV